MKNELKEILNEIKVNYDSDEFDSFSIWLDSIIVKPDNLINNNEVCKNVL